MTERLHPRFLQDTAVCTCWFVYYNFFMPWCWYYASGPGLEFYQWLLLAKPTIVQAAVAGYDLAVNFLLVLPLGLVVARFFSSCWLAIAVAVVVATTWQYRSVMTTYNGFLEFMTLHGAIIGWLTALLVLPITIAVGQFVSKLDGPMTLD